ncbi:hypoxanthine-DNA glycosylase [Mariprofundus aestuarium]|uniref:Hypoxanthine-DNA glycosylase n=1 Tax=Mariprofundus aestuarium TaxID=1921086 RepID=A0A2K8L7H7_MARES|nr:DNA-deoxyinosine glycosylase [Mariprofundus aestuarium]ATX80226.1 hypoxanthine-DNA glycosylase [Mariprofundus aestuarium]
MIDRGFPYSANRDAKILILGSMPSRKSIAADQYYAHPQNGFWPIMGELFGFTASLEYEERLAQLRKNGVGLWDVAHQCVRPGSLDSAIEIESWLQRFRVFL